MLLVIDNYDSFVFNVARYCAELGRPNGSRAGRALRARCAS